MKQVLSTGIHTPDPDLVALFWSNVAPGCGEFSECLEWQGWINKDGYGIVTLEATITTAHRWAWKVFIGDPPSTRHLDHLVCGNRPCANVEHLEPVTRSVNIMRSTLARLTNVAAYDYYERLDRGRRASLRYPAL